MTTSGTTPLLDSFWPYFILNYLIVEIDTNFMSMLKFSSLTKTRIEVELEAKTGFRVGKIGPSKVKENYRDNCIIGPVFSTIF